MSREQKYTAIILKKQPFNEGDEIITLFTKEQGKVRALAKAVKLPKSKLQQKLQGLFLVELTLTAGSKLPKIISVEPVKVFSQMRENLTAAKTAFCALELVLKFTADQQKNQPLFHLLLEFLEFLDSNQAETVLNLGLAKFKIAILELSGLAVGHPLNFLNSEKVFFSLDKGGFINYSDSSVLSVAEATADCFLSLEQTHFNNLNSLPALAGIHQLQNLLSRFIEYQLERKIKAEKYLMEENMI